MRAPQERRHDSLLKYQILLFRARRDVAFLERLCPAPFWFASRAHTRPVLPGVQAEEKVTLQPEIAMVTIRLPVDRRLRPG